MCLLHACVGNNRSNSLYTMPQVLISSSVYLTLGIGLPLEMKKKRNFIRKNHHKPTFEFQFTIDNQMQCLQSLNDVHDKLHRKILDDHYLILVHIWS